MNSIHHPGQRSTATLTRLLLAALMAMLIAMPYAAQATVGQHWQWVNPLPQGNAFKGVAESGTGTYVAVGMHGTVETSSDGQAWTIRDPGTTNDLYAVAWGGAQFVAVGATGTILTSPDGVTWTSHSVSSTLYLYAVIWNGSQYVAIGNAGTILSSADGSTWSVRTSRVTASLQGIAWNGTRFVVVGASGTILSSLDGVSWTVDSSGTTNYLNGVAWNGSQFIAVSVVGYLVSPDGINWTLYTTGAGGYAVAWGNGQFVAASGGIVYTSPDAVNWTANYTSALISSLLWTGSQWLAVGPGGTIYTSPDGAAWTLENPGVTYADTPRASIGGITWQGSRFIAYGGTLGNEVFTSANGFIWTAHSLGSSYPIVDGVTCSSALCVAVGYGGAILTSTDGAQWTVQTSGTTASLNGITWDGTRFVTVGNGGAILTSTDGISWVQRGLGTTTANLNAIGVGGTTLVAVGSSGTILTSTDGAVTWASQSLGSQVFSTVAYGAARFIAAGYQAAPYTSSDGANWAAVSGFGYYLNDLVWTGTQFIGVGNHGTIFTTPDGTTWSQQASGTANIINGVVSNGNTTNRIDVAVGEYGTVLESSDPGIIGAHNVTITPPTSGSEPLTITGAGTLSVTATSSDQTLLPDADISGTSTCTQAGLCTLVLQPAASRTGTATVTLNVADSYGQTASASFTVTVVAPTAPTISGLSSNVTTTQPSNGTVSFTISSPVAVGVNVQSSNTALLPASAISGASACTSAGNCTLTLQPIAGQTGTSVVTVFVTDIYAQGTSASFTVTTSPPAAPTLSGLSNVAITQPASGSETFTIAGGGALTVTDHSTDQTLLPDASITGASACAASGNCTLTLRPVANQSGSATVTVTVTDAYGHSVNANFTATVSAAPSGSGASSGGGGGGAVGLWQLLMLAGLTTTLYRRRRCIEPE